MKQEYYKYLRNEECLWFEFESVSKQKIVKKVVNYNAFVISLKNKENLSLCKFSVANGQYFAILDFKSPVHLSISE